MSVFPTPRIARTLGAGMRTVPSSPSKHMLKEGRTMLLPSVYSPFLIKTAFINDDCLEVFSGCGSCFFCCESIIVSTRGISLFMVEP